jgi:hypothetical protein
MLLYNIKTLQIMTRGVRSLHPIESVGVVYALLRATDHNCFPGTLFNKAARIYLPLYTRVCTHMSLSKQCEPVLLTHD